ncbi:hypothetical protein [Nostoc commune]|nr:hypothetical protein [Nostoc commune]
MIFCISAYILIPKVAVCTGIINTASANTFSASGSNTLISHKVNSENLEDTYVPPNYGGPDSHHGSGTR